MKRSHWTTRLIALVVSCLFTVTSINPVYAHMQPTQAIVPNPLHINGLNQPYEPILIKGLKVNQTNPFEMEFIVSDPKDTRHKTQDTSYQNPTPPARGFSREAAGRANTQHLKSESTQLIKYFLAALTTPEKDMWVNLSPYEKDRIIPESFGQTEMGRELLVQDYLLKQVTASLLHPDGEYGKEFWTKIHTKTRATSNEQLATQDSVLETFNKVWIMPDKAVVYENEGIAYVVEASMKVMLEEDYLAQQHNAVGDDQRVVPNNEGEHIGSPLRDNLSSDLMRKTILPVLEREVNESKNFAKLRQIYHSLILATWYKKKMQSAILTQVYADQNKTDGVGHNDPEAANKIWREYTETFKEGAYNFIKEEYDPEAQQIISKKYFSGGFDTAAMSRQIESINKKELIKRGLSRTLHKAAFFITISLTALWIGENSTLEARGPSKTSAFDRYHRIMEESENKKKNVFVRGHFHSSDAIDQWVNRFISRINRGISNGLENFINKDTTLKYLNIYLEDVKYLKNVLEDPENNIQTIGLETTPNRDDIMLTPQEAVKKLADFTTTINNLGIPNAKNLAENLFLLKHGPVIYLRAIEYPAIEGVNIISMENIKLFKKAAEAVFEFEDYTEDLKMSAVYPGEKEVFENFRDNYLLPSVYSGKRLTNKQVFAAIERISPDISQSFTQRYYKVYKRFMNDALIKRNRVYVRKIRKIQDTTEGDILIVLGGGHAIPIVEGLRRKGAKNTFLSFDAVTQTSVKKDIENAALTEAAPDSAAMSELSQSEGKSFDDVWKEIQAADITNMDINQPRFLGFGRHPHNFLADLPFDLKEIMYTEDEGKTFYEDLENFNPEKDSAEVIFEIIVGLPLAIYLEGYEESRKEPWDDFNTEFPWESFQKALYFVYAHSYADISKDNPIFTSERLTAAAFSGMVEQLKELNIWWDESDFDVPFDYMPDYLSIGENAHKKFIEHFTQPTILIEQAIETIKSDIARNRQVDIETFKKQLEVLINYRELMRVLKTHWGNRHKTLQEVEDKKWHERIRAARKVKTPARERIKTENQPSSRQFIAGEGPALTLGVGSGSIGKYINNLVEGDFLVESFEKDVLSTLDRQGIVSRLNMLFTRRQSPWLQLFNENGNNFISAVIAFQHLTQYNESWQLGAVPEPGLVAFIIGLLKRLENSGSKIHLLPSLNNILNSFNLSLNDPALAEYFMDILVKVVVADFEDLNVINNLTTASTIDKIKDLALSTNPRETELFIHFYTSVYIQGLKEHWMKNTGGSETEFKERLTLALREAKGHNVKEVNEVIDLMLTVADTAAMEEQDSTAPLTLEEQKRIIFDDEFTIDTWALWARPLLNIIYESEFPNVDDFPEELKYPYRKGNSLSFDFQYSWWENKVVPALSDFLSTSSNYASLPNSSEFEISMWTRELITNAFAAVLPKLLTYDIFPGNVNLKVDWVNNSQLIFTFEDNGLGMPTSTLEGFMHPNKNTKLLQHGLLGQPGGDSIGTAIVNERFAALSNDLVSINVDIVTSYLGQTHKKTITYEKGIRKDSKVAPLGEFRPSGTIITVSLDGLQRYKKEGKYASRSWSWKAGEGYIKSKEQGSSAIIPKEEFSLTLKEVFGLTEEQLDQLVWGENFGYPEAFQLLVKRVEARETDPESIITHAQISSEILYRAILNKVKRDLSFDNLLIYLPKGTPLSDIYHWDYSMRNNEILENGFSTLGRVLEEPSYITAENAWNEYIEGWKAINRILHGIFLLSMRFHQDEKSINMDKGFNRLLQGATQHRVVTYTKLKERFIKSVGEENNLLETAANIWIFLNEDFSEEKLRELRQKAPNIFYIFIEQLSELAKTYNSKRARELVDKLDDGQRKNIELDRNFIEYEKLLRDYFEIVEKPLFKKFKNKPFNAFEAFRSGKVQFGDFAVVSQHDTAAMEDQNNLKGGIDFDSSKIDLEVTSDPLLVASCSSLEDKQKRAECFSSNQQQATSNKGIEFHFTSEQIKDMRQNITGFNPVIMSIQPIVNLPLFLGLNDFNEEPADTETVEADSSDLLAKLEEFSYNNFN